VFEGSWKRKHRSNDNQREEGRKGTPISQTVTMFFKPKSQTLHTYNP